MARSRPRLFPLKIAWPLIDNSGRERDVNRN
jgi:hypothetical protein